MKVFITGGTGYTGQATITALRAHGHDVVALARSQRAAQRLELLGAETVAGDLADTDTLATQPNTPTPQSIWRRTTPPVPPQPILAPPPRFNTDSVHDRMFTRAGLNTIGVVDETAPQSPPPLTSWRPDNEKRVLARTDDGGPPVLVMPGTVYGHGGGLITEFLAKPARTGAAHYIGAGGNYGP